MLVKLSDIKTFAPRALDGWVGKLEDFYFDDEKWTLRYFVVEAGTWLLHRRSVLISPFVFDGVDKEDKIIYINLTREQIGNSPSVDTTKPISRQYEEKLARHYQWSAYWAKPFGGVYYQGSATSPGPAPYPGRYREPGTATEEKNRPEPQDTHIRSTAEVKKYDVEAEDGKLGEAEDFIVDDDTWEIRYLQIGTGKWWTDNHILLSPRWVTGISWESQSIDFKISRQAIRTAPAYNPAAPITAEYERQLDQYYRFLVEK